MAAKLVDLFGFDSLPRQPSIIDTPAIVRLSPSDSFLYPAIAKPTHSLIILGFLIVPLCTVFSPVFLA
jgi:hypothetical protein